ncbi:MAG: flagellar basal body-associated FliL family protein [Spirochaetaceae bacterium]|jgi:flagellar basal body-associated protein FliL|nr:flagellar basal body-associated FliL family protein [Spirochaetaceae bacterium]
MEQTPLKNTGAARILTVSYRVLIIIGLALALFLAGGTVYGLLFKHAKPIYTVPAPAPPPPQGRNPPLDSRIFTGIGRLRIMSGDTPPVTVVVSIAFPYNPQDVPFAEELASKIPDLRNAAAEYFRGRGAEELGGMDEQDIKAELLGRYNRLLRLGAIDTLYFNDFMLID